MLTIAPQSLRAMAEGPRQEILIQLISLDNADNPRNVGVVEQMSTDPKNIRRKYQ